MKTSAGLAAWLADGEAQRRSLDGVEAFAEKWGKQPLMMALHRDLTNLERPDPQAILAVGRRFMDQTDELGALIRDMIRSSRADPFFRPPFHPLSSDIHEGLLLFLHEHLSVAVGVAPVDMLAAKKSGKRGATSIHFTGMHAVYRYLKAGDAIISLWEAPPITEDFVAANAGQCRLVGRRRLKDGDEIEIDGSHQSFVVEHASSDLLYLQAMVRSKAAPLNTEYDSATMNFVGASSTDEASSRVQMMVSLLRTMEREDALPLMIEALKSPHFYTRWHIMRELLAMDAELALPALREMAANDAHPDVRAVAGRTLETLFDGEGAEPCPA